MKLLDNPFELGVLWKNYRDTKDMQIEKAAAPLTLRIKYTTHNEHEHFLN